MSKFNKKNEEEKIVEAQVKEPENDEATEENPNEDAPTPAVEVEVKKNFLERKVDAMYQKRVDRAKKRAQKQAEKAAAKTEETEKVPLGLKIAVGVAATGAVIKTGFRIWDAVNNARNHSEDETTEGEHEYYEETGVETQEEAETTEEN